MVVRSARMKRVACVLVVLVALAMTAAAVASDSQYLRFKVRSGHATRVCSPKFPGQLFAQAAYIGHLRLRVVAGQNTEVFSGRRTHLKVTTVGAGVCVRATTRQSSVHVRVLLHEIRLGKPEQLVN